MNSTQAGDTGTDLEQIASLLRAEARGMHNTVTATSPNPTFGRYAQRRATIIRNGYEAMGVALADLAAEALVDSLSDLVMDDATHLIGPCPECVAGKCGNCDGTSWDTAQDVLAACPCSSNGHPRKTA